MVESTPDGRGGRVCTSGGTSERDGGGKGLFESIDEADGATCLRSAPLYTRLLFRSVSLWLSLSPAPPHLSLVVADVTRRYILLNE